MVAAVHNGRLKRAGGRRKCNVCGQDGCGIGEGITLCWRVESGMQAKSGAWIHRDPNASPVQPIVYAPPVIADIERRHAVYSALLERLPLLASHADHLMTARGLSDDTITREAYASMPTRAEGDAIAASLAKDFNLEHVPGFWKRYERWVMRFPGLSGIVIPLRDHIGRVQALQIRRDQAEQGSRYLMFSSADLPSGASCGGPAHYCRPYLAHQEVIITEGALKAAIASEYLKACVVGLVAVGTFSDAIGRALVRDLGNVGRATIAYDADWRTNDKVRYQMRRLHDALRAAEIPVRIAIWNPEDGKGIDDYLLSKGAGEWR